LLEEQSGERVEPNIISVWSGEYGWADRFTEDMEKVFPQSRKETAGNLVTAGVMASRRLLAHFNGQPMEKGEEKILFGALDRAGFSPVGSRDPVGGQSSGSIEQSSLVQKMLSPEDIRSIRAEAGLETDPDMVIVDIE